MRTTSLHSVAGIAVATAFAQVKITNGTVQGVQCLDNTRSIAYLGIPFGAAPEGDLRFAPPQVYDQTYPGGTLNATTPAPSCTQFGKVFMEPPPVVEDWCVALRPKLARRPPPRRALTLRAGSLFLDIWAPANAMAVSGLPVRVWIYGGSETTSGITDPLYDGCNVLDSGAIQVSLNYRLGPLGWLALSSAGIAGNQGIKDIVLGLEWVQDNIAAFGGDLVRLAIAEPMCSLAGTCRANSRRKKVMLYGQSAGAINVYEVAVLPQAPKLMLAAAMESGAGRDLPTKQN